MNVDISLQKTKKKVDFKGEKWKKARRNTKIKRD